MLDILFNGAPIIGHKCNALNFISISNVGYLFDDIKEVNFRDIINKEKYLHKKIYISYGERSGINQVPFPNEIELI